MTAAAAWPTGWAGRRSRPRSPLLSCATAGTMSCSPRTPAPRRSMSTASSCRRGPPGPRPRRSHGTSCATAPRRISSAAGVRTKSRSTEPALDAATVRAHFLAGRDVADQTAPAAPPGLTASARFGRVDLRWSANGESDLDGYDVFRATSPAGPFARVNPSRLETTAFTDTTVTGGTAYVYAVTASDTANQRSADSAQVTGTPPSTTDLLRQYAPELRFETQESYFADSAAEMTDNYVAGARTNSLVDGSGTRIAAANPADALPDLSLGFLGNPVYANGR